MSESNTFFYVIVFIVIAHFIVGFYFLVKKLSAKPKSETESKEMNEENDTRPKA